MMKRFIFGFLLIVVTHVVQGQSATTFILVRHAEKATEGGSDPELKPEGIKRAENFAALFSKTTVTAIYSTDYKRTRNTVMPLANGMSLPITTYASMKAVDLEKLLMKHTGGTIVIAGHSNTIPEIANVLTGDKKFTQFADDDYGNILIITVQQVGKDAKVIWLRY